MVVVVLNLWLSKVKEFKKCPTDQQRSPKESELVVKRQKLAGTSQPRRSVTGFQGREEKDHLGDERNREIKEKEERRNEVFE